MRSGRCQAGATRMDVRLLASPAACAILAGTRQDANACAVDLCRHPSLFQRATRRPIGARAPGPHLSGTAERRGGRLPKKKPAGIVIGFSIYVDELPVFVALCGVGFVADTGSGQGHTVPSQEDGCDYAMLLPT